MASGHNNKLFYMEQKGTSEKAGLNRIPDEKGRMVFPPGVSGNPSGRPVGSVSIVEAIKRKLLECPLGEDKKTYMEVFVEKVFEKANKDGDVSMMKDIINRIDGMPSQNIDHTSKGEKIESTIQLQGMDALIESMSQANRKDYETNSSAEGLRSTKRHTSLVERESVDE